MPHITAESDIRKISTKYIHQTEEGSRSGLVQKRRLGQKPKAGEIEEELPVEHHYLLSPLSAMLKVQLNSDDTDLSFPKVVANLLLDAINLNLSEHQFRAFDDFLGVDEKFSGCFSVPRFSACPIPKERSRCVVEIRIPVCCQREQEEGLCLELGVSQKKGRFCEKSMSRCTKKDSGRRFLPEGSKELLRLELDEEMLSIDDILIFRSIANEVLKREAKGGKGKEVAREEGKR